jgi:LysM domain.
VNLTGQVKRGDSRARLAQQNNLSIAQLKALNPSMATLEPNQELVI